MSRAAYDEALTVSNKASATYREIARKYHTRQIGDDEFLAARKVHEEALSAFTVARDAFDAEAAALAKAIDKKLSPTKRAALVRLSKGRESSWGFGGGVVGWMRRFGYCENARLEAKDFDEDLFKPAFGQIGDVVLGVLQITQAGRDRLLRP